MEGPVLGAPLRADFENKLNPYDKIGFSMDEEVSTAKVKGSQRKRTLET